MFCKKCGTWMPEDVPACFQCGAKNENFVEAPRRAEDASEAVPFNSRADDGQDVPAEPKQGAEERKFLVGVSVLAACIIVFVMLFGTGVVGTGSRKDILLYCRADFFQYLFFNEDGKTKEIEGIPNDAFVISSADRTKAVYINPAESTLHYIDSRLKPVKITDGVVTAQFSLTGDRFAYMTFNNANINRLYIYDIEKKESTQISAKVYYDYVCLSPGGKAAAYLKNYVNMYQNELYLYSDGNESILVGRNGCIPVAVSDDGKNCFYIKLSNKIGDGDFIYDLYYFDGKDRVLISDNIDDQQVFTNRNVNELLYNKDSKTYYFSIKQGEPQCIGQNYLTMMVADTVNYIREGPSITCNLDTLTDAFYRDDSSIIWFGNDGLCSVDVAVQGADCAISEDGSTLLYLYGGYLYKLQKSSDNAQPELLCESLKAAGLVTSIDLSQIYLITGDNEMYHYRDSGHVTKLSSDVQFYWGALQVVYSEIDNKIYFIENNILYCASENDNRKQVAQDVEWVSTENGFITYYTENNDGNAIYILTKHGAVKVYSH